MGSSITILAIITLIVVAWMRNDDGCWLASAVRVYATIGIVCVLSYSMHRWGIHGRMLPSILWDMHRKHHRHDDREDVDKDQDHDDGVLGEVGIDVLAGVMLVPLTFVGLADLPSIVFFTVAYTCGHLLMYHRGNAHDDVRGRVHREHHRRPTTNFGPYVMDIAFGTTTEGVVESLDNLTPCILCGLLAGLAVSVFCAP